jgi:hypothetical protein
MNAKVTLQPKQDKDRLHEVYVPLVRFQIPSELRTAWYVSWLNGIFADFIRFLSSSRVNESNARRFYFSAVGEEGGIGTIYIGETYFDHCKLFVYDGESRHVADDWKGVIMANHSVQRSKVAPLYTLAEKLEEFLRTRNIPYQRFGRKLHEETECEQVTEWS